MTPHDVDSHRVPSNASSRSTPSATHQPRSWSKADAPANIISMSVTLWTAQSPMSWSKAEAPANISFMSVTPEVSQAPMSWLKTEA